MSDIKVGDVVMSRKCPTLIGVVEKVGSGGSGIVRVNDKLVLTVLEYWRKVKDQSWVKFK